MSLTLAFELAGLRRLADPEAAVTDARSWSEHVGVVTDRPPYVLTKFTRDNYIRNDFEPASEPAAVTLAHLLEHFDTDRFVYVCIDSDAAPDGWDARTIEDAASDAGWELVEEGAAGTDESPDDTSVPSRHDWP